MLENAILTVETAEIHKKNAVVGQDSAENTREKTAEEKAKACIEKITAEKSQESVARQNSLAERKAEAELEEALIWVAVAKMHMADCLRDRDADASGAAVDLVVAGAAPGPSGAGEGLVPARRSALLTRAGRTGLPSLSHPPVRPLTDLAVEVAVVPAAKKRVRFERGTK